MSKLLIIVLMFSLSGLSLNGQMPDNHIQDWVSQNELDFEKCEKSCEFRHNRNYDLFIVCRINCKNEFKDYAKWYKSYEKYRVYLNKLKIRAVSELLEIESSRKEG